MGLDVYFRIVPNLEKKLSLEKQAEEFMEQSWNELIGEHVKYEQAPEEQLEKWRAARLAKFAELGLDDYGCYTDGEYNISAPSAKHPDHMFNLGYYRSSYNEGGINSLARSYGLPDLYYIFGDDVSDENYYVKPNFEAALVRAKEALEKWKEYAVSPAGKYSVLEVTLNVFHEPRALDKQESVNMVAAEFSQDRQYNAWSNGIGEFDKEGIKVVAVLPGLVKFLGRQVPGVHVVYENTEGLNWYIQALEVVVESIEYLMNHPERDQLYMSWSG